MRYLAVTLIVLLTVAVPVRADDTENPHVMVKPDGKLDMEKCGACHEDDMSLSRSKLETCTLCHGMTPHSGAAEHLRASPAEVAQLLPPGRNTAPELPLTDKGGIFCGTCHLFHDPAVADEQPLKRPWLPPTAGFSGGVERSLSAHWKGIAEKYKQKSPDAHFATVANKWLRLPIKDGSLCRHCHTTLP